MIKSTTMQLLLQITALLGVDSLPQLAPVSFKKDFSANLDEVRQFGGDFLPKFEFGDFFQKLDATDAETGSAREGRKNEYPEYDSSEPPFEYPTKYSKMQRQMPVRQNVREQISERDRSDKHAPLFRETVEQVLDNRHLKPDGRRNSQNDEFSSRSTLEPESRQDRPGLVSPFVQQPFRVPQEFRSQIGFDSDELTGFNAPFGESGSGFAKFLREVGNRPDAFGSGNFDGQNDRTVADDLDQLQKGRQQRPKHRQNKRPKQRRPFSSGERRTTFDDEYADEYEDDDEVEEIEERHLSFGNYKPTFRKTTYETENDGSQYSYDNVKNQRTPTQSSYQQPYQFDYHSNQDYEQRPEYHFSNERSDQGYPTVVKPPQSEDPYQINPKFEEVYQTVVAPPQSTENYANNFREPFPSIENSNFAPFPTSSSERRQESEPDFGAEILQKFTESISEQPVTLPQELVDTEPNIKNGFFSNYQVQDFTKVPAEKAPTAPAYPSRSDDVSTPSNSESGFVRQTTFTFQPFQDFNSFFSKDIGFEFDKDPAYLALQQQQKSTQEVIQQTAALPKEITATSTTSTTTTTSELPSYSATTPAVTTTTSTTTTTQTTTQTYYAKVDTEATTSSVFYKPFDKNDTRFTPGPVYYKPIELVNSTSAFYKAAEETTAPPKSTTQGWKAKVGDSFVDVNAAPKSDIVDSYGNPISTDKSYTAPSSDSYIEPAEPTAETYIAPFVETNSEPASIYDAPKTISLTEPNTETYGAPEAYGAPKTEATSIAPTSNNYGAPNVDAYGAPSVDTYGAPSVDTYGSPKVESYSAQKSEAVDSYGAPKSGAVDSYGAPLTAAVDSYGAPKAEVVDSYGAPKAEPLDSYGAPKAAPIETGQSEYSNVPPPPPVPQPAHSSQGSKHPPRNNRPRRLTPFGRVINGARIIMAEQSNRLKTVRNTPLGRSAAIILSSKLI